MSSENTIYFWRETEKNGFLSNWYEAPFVIGDFQYKWVEQFMMSQKAILFGDARTNNKILNAATPKECKKLGKYVKPFDPEIWDAKKCEIVYKGNYAKFEQNPALLNKLKETGDATLVEASPYDKIWGIGLKARDAEKVDPEDWPGENLLGQILMKVRSDL